MWPGSRAGTGSADGAAGGNATVCSACGDVGADEIATVASSAVDVAGADEIATVASSAVDVAECNAEGFGSVAFGGVCRTVVASSGSGTAGKGIVGSAS